MSRAAAQPARMVESEVEDAALAWLQSLGYGVRYGPDIACGEPDAERHDPGYRDVILEGRLRQALARMNPDIPPQGLEDALRRLRAPEGSSLILRNRSSQAMLANGIPVEFARADGAAASAIARVLDFDDPANNDWLAVSQFTVVDGQRERRPDIVVFANGLPIAVLELKNAADENATVWHAYDQLQTYKAEIPALFEHNVLLAISDGLEARAGSLTARRERFMAWRTIEGEALAPPRVPQLEVLLRGLFDPARLLQFIRGFVVFEDQGGGALDKKIAAYHQFHAVNLAVATTLAAARAGGGHRAGVVWHTQGSGKSLTMAFYAGRVITEPAFNNPTVVVLTDRNDLDNQLFATFCRCQALLRQPPQQAENREHLRELLGHSSGGVVFTTIQKFFPENGRAMPRLSARRNIIVIADEAHRSQYDFVDGFARHLRDALPNASFIGFTGTPVEKTGASTRAVFGYYIGIPYDIRRAVEDHATVPIYYEARLAKLDLPEAEKPKLDRDFEEVTETEEDAARERLKTKWAALEAVVGSEKRLAALAADILAHFEQRLEVLDGKALVVCMSRRICTEPYQQIIALRPAWHSGDDAAGAVKVVMTGSAADGPAWQPHIRDKSRRDALANRFKDAADPFRIAIVRDMWLTGFDAPCLHTMYLDKPMRGHGLMQAIARVNRVYQDKPGGLMVDYLGIGPELKAALATYTESGGQGQPAMDQAQAVALMREKYEVCCGLFHGFGHSAWTRRSATAGLALLAGAQEHILAQRDGKPRCLAAVSELTQAHALAVPHPEALRIRDDLGFFQAVRAQLAKTSASDARPGPDLDHAIRQLVSAALTSGGVQDIFAAAGLKRPDISILSDQFLAEVKRMPHKNLAVELLGKLLRGEIKTRLARNVVRSKLFSEMLAQSIRKYQNRAIEAAQVIEELIALSKEIRAAERRGEQLGLTAEETAFYDALGVSGSAVKVLDDDALKAIARELVATVRKNTTIDWTIRESARARLRVLVKRILRQRGYPLEQQEKATSTVLEQAEALSAAWV